MPFSQLLVSCLTLLSVQNNPSIKNLEKSKELFANDEKSRPIGVIAVAKGDNLLTLEAFKEMVEFEKVLFSITELDDTDYDEDKKEEVRPGKGNPVSFIDICDSQTYDDPRVKDGKIVKCNSRGQPIDYFYDLTKTDHYDLSGFTQASLLQRINSGRNEQLDETFRVNTFLAEVVPEDYT